MPTLRSAADPLAARCTAYGYAFAVDLTFCHAAATDQANMAMRAACRTAWSEDDFWLAADTEDKLVKNAAACFAAGIFMWPANERFYGKALKAAIQAQAREERRAAA